MSQERVALDKVVEYLGGASSSEREPARCPATVPWIVESP